MSNKKAVLMSIHPKWCAKIAWGEKIVELRKTSPRELAKPFKVYIYCTKGRHETLWRFGKNYYYDYQFPNERPNRVAGKVIGEFVCHRVIPISVKYSDPENALASRTFPYLGMTDKEIMDYLGNGVEGCGWAISDLVMYDTPRELSEFGVRCREYDKPRPMCGDCEHYHYESNEAIGTYEECLCEGFKPLLRPPQSWCYVEELKGSAE